MIKPYPLQWPLGYPRTQYPQVNGHFKSSFAAARDRCIAEIKRLGGTDIVISTDIPTRGDGLPYANAERRTMKSQGVAVYFNYNGGQRVFCCDKWDRVERNMQAIALSIQALRGLDRWGVSQMLERVFTGFEALPEVSENAWHVVLGVDKNATPEVVKEAYRMLMLQHHPDKGGRREDFDAVTKAYNEYKSQQ